MRLKKRISGFYIRVFLILLFFDACHSIRNYTREDVMGLREEVREMFQHAYNGYLEYASGFDELRPLTCDGVNTWGSYSLTLIDALDTLAVMGNYTEFRRVVKILTEKSNFDSDINVSVFETNIRIVGGLLSAHLLSRKAGVDLEPGWPCNGPLLRLAEDVARRLLPAFDTKTGMPYGTVNLKYGVPPGETSVTCTAGVGTFIVEFGTLSRLTGNPIFEEFALNAIYSLWNHRSSIGLLGNHIDVQTGRWIAQDAGIGAGVDSFYEYLAKGALMLYRSDLLEIFHEGRKSIDKYLRRDDWHVWVTMSKGQVTLPVFQSLEAYWPGVLSLIGENNLAMRTLLNYYSVWRQYGFLPEFFNIPVGEASLNRESYPLRPELIESIMYLYKATEDPILLEMGEEILRSIQHSAKTDCGYSTIRNVKTHTKENRMESFFLAETTKYLYLLFDRDNFLHNRGEEGILFEVSNGHECIIEAGGYVYNTEAHPTDPSALQCCYELHNSENIFENFNLDDYSIEAVNMKERKESTMNCKDNILKTEFPEIILEFDAETSTSEKNSGVHVQKIAKEVTNILEQAAIEKQKEILQNVTSTAATNDKITPRIKIDEKQSENAEMSEHLSNLWKTLESVVGKSLKGEDGYSSFKKIEGELIKILKVLMKTINAKESSSTAPVDSPIILNDNDSNKSVKTLYDIYESREKIKLALHVIDMISNYENSNETKDTMFDLVLGILTEKKKIQNLKLNETLTRDLVGILAKAQRAYEDSFNDAINMFEFLADVKESKLLNRGALKVILHHLQEARSKTGIKGKHKTQEELKLEYFETLVKSISLKKKMNEVLKKVDILEKKHYDYINNLDRNITSENDDVGENVAENERKRNVSGDMKTGEKSDDIIVVADKTAGDFGVGTNNDELRERDDIGVGTVEPVHAYRREPSYTVNVEAMTSHPINEEQEVPPPAPTPPPRTETNPAEEPSNNFSIFTNFVQSVIESTFPSKRRFDPSSLLERIRSEGKYSNYTENYEVFYCKAPPFKEKFSIWGEIY